MKGDFSRDTFAREKHYASVLMQQGRVAVDADWNEQQAITRYRTETETIDVVGQSGTPLDPPAFLEASGFRIQSAGGGTTFSIGPGRYYVDGLLAENEQQVQYGQQGGAQLDFPSPPALTDVLAPGELGLVYLDVWHRHVTPLDDPLIQEKALGEADTATRMRTAWQVKVLPLPGVGASPPPACDAAFTDWTNLVAASTGTLTARSRRPTAAPDPCQPPPSAGYLRLENQLYRVEVHRPSSQSGGPTFKWSRENGSILTDVVEFKSGNRVQVASLGRDTELGFADGQWVELVNDFTELDTDGTRLGQLAQIDHIDGDHLVLKTAPADTDLTRHPKVRRWDHVQRPQPEPVAVTANGIAVQQSVEVPIEDGVRVTFGPGTYHAGDYWLIPARTASGDVEWPQNGTGPAMLAPKGVKHHYARLGYVRRDGTSIGVLSDCREKFPPLTELTSFFYLGGDGQEVMPDEQRGANTAIDLPETLRVGVARGRHPVPGATVLFEVLGGVNGMVRPAGSAPPGQQNAPVPTDANGVAEVTWAIASDAPKQQVQATLQVNGVATHLPILFSAERSTAEEVRYFPPGDGKTCETLKDAHEVQTAIDALAERARLEYVSGDAQEVMPAVGSLQPLRVRVQSPCGPVPGATVAWTGDGTLTTKSPTTDGDGLAEAVWTLDPGKEAQVATATLTDLGANAGDHASFHASSAIVQFGANLSTADQVGYVPGCTPLKNAKIATVEAALNELCKLLGEQTQPGIRILRVLRGDGNDLKNDDDVPVGAWLAGKVAPVTVEFDKPVDPKLVLGNTGKTGLNPRVVVTLELPFPLGAERDFLGGNLVGFQPIVLAGEVAVPRGSKELRWTPEDATGRWLQEVIFRLLGDAPRVLVRVTLKGEFIGRGKLVLDGEPFGPNSSVGTAKTSGDGRAGGDFELWFWLTPNPAPPQPPPPGPVPTPEPPVVPGPTPVVPQPTGPPLGPFRPGVPEGPVPPIGPP